MENPASCWIDMKESIATMWGKLAEACWNLREACGNLRGSSRELAGARGILAADLQTICRGFPELRKVWESVLRIQIGGEGVAVGRSGDDSVVERVRATRVVGGGGQGVGP